MNEEKILFAVDVKGHIFPLFASGRIVEFQVYEDTETNWNYDVDIDGIPAEPGLYVWEGNPKPEYESDGEYSKSYIVGYSYGNSWRLPDQIEWLSIIENVCPWDSKKNEELEEASQKDFYNFLDGRLDLSREKLEESILNK